MLQLKILQEAPQNAIPYPLLVHSTSSKGSVMSSSPPSPFDHSSDPHFLSYYAEASLSEVTRGRFERVRDAALALLAEHGAAGQPLVILDIGCGAGAQALLWAELGHRVCGLDVNEPLITLGRERAREKGLVIDFRIGTATQLPFEKESADVVLLPELLEHVAEWEACLSEAVRVLRPGGLLYLSTTNKLCPKQQEFTLPAYSWYPPPVKRWCVRKSLTTHPQWANYARYPAVNWFSYYELRDWLKRRGMNPLDRFDILSRKPLLATARLLVKALRAIPPLRFMAHVATPDSTVWAFKDNRS